MEAELLVFPGPESATGEDVLEWHLPGSLPVGDALLDALLDHGRAQGLRLAEAGEFTRRAFLNGRLDLTQAEAVLALVSAGSGAEARAAAALLGGALSECLRKTRDALQAALVELEAGLDFEEGDSQDLEPGDVDALLDRAELALAEGLRGEEARQLTESGLPCIALLGPPNAGKSALVQALTGEARLVSAEAGTTRDWRETAWRAPGEESDWVLLDGPGLGEAAVDARDRAAREQASGNLPQVDLWWRCADPADPAAPPALPQEAPVLQVWTKTDLGHPPPAMAPAAEAEVRISAHSGVGLPELATQTAALLRRGAEDRAAVAAVSERHQAALQEALLQLAQARALVAAAEAQDLVAEHLRAALNELAGLVGRFTPEDLLDRLFARFCVGK